MNNEESTQSMRILIAGTGQSGNTWLLYLLAEAYGIPIINLPLDYNFETAEEIPGSWIAQEHFHYKHSIADWAKKNSVRIVTPIRHPGDVLLSQLNHLKASLAAGNQLMSHECLLTDETSWDSPKRIKFVCDHFYFELACSMSWLDSGRSIIIRYEDLWRDTPSAMRAICDRLSPLSDSKIHGAVRVTTKSFLAQWSDTQKSRFRKGNIGEWRTELPQKIIGIFASQQPYPLFFARMGYTLDPEDPIIAAPRIHEHLSVRLLEGNYFRDGSEISPIITRIYAYASQETASFEDLDSFYSWLNAPAENDPFPEKPPFISNLVAQIHKIHPGLSQRFPDLFDQNRIRFVYLWFLQNAASELHLSDHFIQPIRDSFIHWATQIYEEDLTMPRRAPDITNLAMLVYNCSKEVRHGFPFPLDASRTMFAAWCIKNLPDVAALPRSVVDPIIVSWSHAPSGISHK